MFKLVCPHGKLINVEDENGVQVYKHKDTGNYCSHLNTFSVDTNEIYRKQMVVALKEFTPELVRDFLLEIKSKNHMLVKKLEYRTIHDLMKIIHNFFVNKSTRRGFNNVYYVTKDKKYRVLFHILDLFCKSNVARKQFYERMLKYVKANKSYSVEYLIFYFMCVNYYVEYAHYHSLSLLSVKCCYENLIGEVDAMSVTYMNDGATYMHLSLHMPLFELYVLLGKSDVILVQKCAEIKFAKDYAYAAFGARQVDIVSLIWQTNRNHNLFANAVNTLKAQNSLDSTIWKLHFMKIIDCNLNLKDAYNSLIQDCADEKYISNSLQGYTNAFKKYVSMGPIGGVATTVKNLNKSFDASAFRQEEKLRESNKAIAKMFKDLTANQVFVPWLGIGKD